MKHFSRMVRGFACAVAAAGVLSGIGTVPVMAQYNQQEAEETAVPEVVKEKKPDGTPFSVQGNGEVLDDISNDETKQFITVRTKNNQTFFVVIDMASAVDNVYMLSMIDENDLEEFLEESKDKGKANIQIPEQTAESQKADQSVQEVTAEKEKSSGSWGMLFAAVGFVGLFAGGYYYLKIYKPKQKKSEIVSDQSEDEDSEYDDGYEDDDADADAEYSDYDEEDVADSDSEYDDEEYEEDTADPDSEDDEEYEEDGSYEEDEEPEEDRRPARRRRRRRKA